MKIQTYKKIFFSYARKDNQAATFNHIIDNPIFTFKEKFLSRYKGRDKDELIFFDEDNIEAGQKIKHEILSAIEGCAIMFVFFSPDYFRSEYCHDEWIFFKSIQNTGNNSKKIIPIEVEPIANYLNEIYGLFDDSESWIDELTNASSDTGLNFSITSDMLLKKEAENELFNAINKLISSIIPHIENYIGKKTDQGHSNILSIKGLITDHFSKAVKTEIVNFKGKFNAAPVCVIYTGGTVGMIKSTDSDEFHTDFLMASSVKQLTNILHPKLAILPFDIHFVGLKNTIDSSNIKSSDWITLAKIILEQINNYQGFVILHGTNTMAYTSSMLSFLLEGLNKPVVLTGSEVPIGAPNNDAEHNIINAIRTAAPDAKNSPLSVKEVTVFYANSLFRGNRVTKKNASDRSDSFYTPNENVPLGTLKDDRLIVNYNQLRSDYELPNLVDSKSLRPLDAKVIILPVFPEMDISAYKSLIENHDDDVRGVILQSYGSGNTPDDDDFIGFIKYLINEKFIVVANITECEYGKVELKVFETSAVLFDIGVANGGDMTVEAAYCKLLYLLTKSSTSKSLTNVRSIKNRFEHNLRGELSISTNTLQFPFDIFGSIDNLKESEPAKFGNHFERRSIVDAFIRLERMKFKSQQEEAIEIIIYLGKPNNGFEESRDDLNCLVSFTKKLSLSEREKGFFEKNLEVTHTFRKSYNSKDPLFITIGIVGGVDFEFRSIQLEPV